MSLLVIKHKCHPYESWKNDEVTPMLNNLSIRIQHIIK